MLQACFSTSLFSKPEAFPDFDEGQLPLAQRDEIQSQVHLVWLLQENICFTDQQANPCESQQKEGAVVPRYTSSYTSTDHFALRQWGLFRLPEATHSEVGHRAGLGVQPVHLPQVGAALRRGATRGSSGGSGGCCLFIGA